MRLVLLALSALFLLCLTGCGSSLDKGPTTPVEIQHLQATLPGADWHQASQARLGELDAERWENADGTRFFRVASNPEETLDYPRILNDHVDMYVVLMDFPPSTLIERGTIMGRDAVRIEGVSPDSTGYRTLDYVFVAGFRHFYVGAGATNSTWDTGGADFVYDVLQTVKVALVK